MNPPDQNKFDKTCSSGGFEETLRLVASLSAPEGLEERVEVSLRAELRAAPRAVSGRARILRWPAALRPNSSWVLSSLARSAAAAAIAAVVIGGGWGVYSRVEPLQPARAIAIPPHVAASGGFSSAGAMRTPQTLDGPLVAHPVIAAAATSNAANKIPAQAPFLRVKPALAKKVVAKPVAPLAASGTQRKDAPIVQ
jgi:hypothetical protein